MRIGALARRTGVSGRLLRYYEEQGLLQPTRLTNGYREYAESDVAVVSHIRELLAAGLPTTVIAQVLHCVHDDGARLVPAACPGMVDHLERERARIVDAIAQLGTAQQALDNLLAAMPERSAGPAEPGPEQLPGEVPVQRVAQPQLPRRGLPVQFSSGSPA